MQISFLSVIGLMLVTLNANGIVNLPWWMVFSPVIGDVILAMIKSIEKQAEEDAIADALINVIKQYEGDDLK